MMNQQLDQSIQNSQSTIGYLQQIDELKKELFDLKDKNKVLQDKFQKCKKDRDDLKTENKEL